MWRRRSSGCEWRLTEVGEERVGYGVCGVMSRARFGANWQASGGEASRLQPESAMARLVR